jgi:hypothetical protein
MKPRFRPPLSSAGMPYGSPDEPYWLRKTPWITSAIPNVSKRP